MEKNWYLQEYSGYDAVPFIVELVKNVKSFSYPLENFAEWLAANINNPDVKIHLVIKDKDIVGFGVAELCYELNIPIIAIQVGYVPPEVQGGVDEWMAQLTEWAKKVGAKSLKMKVSKHIEGWGKKYGFEVENYTLTREVK